MSFSFARISAPKALSRFACDQGSTGSPPEGLGGFVLYENIEVFSKNLRIRES